MNQIRMRPVLMTALIFAVLGLSTVTAKAGLDSYEIYLNNKLILKQYVNQPLSLKNLPLSKAGADDKLTIYYSQCNAEGKSGKGRRIAVKDKKGNIVKEWKFADAKTGDTGMVIPVKELLALEKNGGGSQLDLYYIAEGRPDGQMLASL